jgi:two-component system chemotaxis sensor kinase CheA
MSTKDEEFLESLRATFRVEAEEHLQGIAAGLLAMEKAHTPGEERSIVETIFRSAHSLKGAARAVNLTEVELICQSLEDVFAAWKRQENKPTPQLLDTLHRALDAVSASVADSAASPGRAGRESLSSYVRLLRQPNVAATTSEPEVDDVPAKDALPPLSQDITERTATTETVRIAVAKLDARLLEAEELLAAKIAAGQRAGELRELVDRLEEWKKKWAQVQPIVRGLVQTIERSAADSSPELTKVVEFIDWAHDYFRSLENKMVGFKRTAEQDCLLIGKLVDDLLEDSKRLLMLPVSTLGALLPKLVRDLCRDQNRDADLVIHGQEIEIDKRILEEMKDPLIHLLRNCVCHGIEAPEMRARLGKPPRATITFSVAQLSGGTKVELAVSDDGAGIDVATAKEAAVKHGRVSREEADRLSESEAADLIFLSEVSTSPIITQLSGRGLGLAIVREKAAMLGGSVSVESRRNVGTTIRIELPIALATFRGVLVETAKQLFIMPTSRVERVARYRPEDVKTVEGLETIALNGRVLPLVRLADVLELSSERNNDGVETSPVIVLGIADQRVAFAVDAVLDERQVLVKPFGKPLSRVRNIAGATLLGSGHVVPILSAADLMASAKKIGGAASHVGTREKSTETNALSILVVEDSITSRMLLKGILESAGYRVTTAVDGIEAFTMLRSVRFDLVVSDVEMPRMNGFDLTAKIRADKSLSELPVLLVTALETREDRERGIDVGANAYIVKSNFDQSNLLEAVRRLA